MGLGCNKHYHLEGDTFSDSGHGSIGYDSWPFLIHDFVVDMFFPFRVIMIVDKDYSCLSILVDGE